METGAASYPAPALAHGPMHRATRAITHQALRTQARPTTIPGVGFALTSMRRQCSRVTPCLPKTRMLLHTRTDVTPWRHPTLAALDATLRAAGSTEVTLPWETCALEQDGLHFTLHGQRVFDTLFADAIVRALPVGHSPAPLLVLTDSTVGYHDWSEDGQWHGRASRRLERVLSARGVNATVDAVCGSGFVARAREGLNFRARIPDAPHDVCFVGGWNDLAWPQESVVAAARGAASRISTLRRHTPSHATLYQMRSLDHPLGQAHDSTASGEASGEEGGAASVAEA